MSDQSDSQRLPQRGGGKLGWVPWYVWDIIVLGSLFLCLTFYNAHSVFSYVIGLSNDGLLLFRSIGWFVLLMPLTFVCLVAAAVCIFVRWPRRVGCCKRLRRLQVGVTVALVVYLALPFTGILPPGYQTYTWGFRKYARTNVDVPAVQRWLGGLDPNLCTGVWMDRREWQDADIDWPDSVARLDPDRIILSLDGEDFPTLRLEWFGFDSFWGLVIGHANMEIPKTLPAVRGQFPQQGEYRLPFARGAYVWHNTG